MAISLKNIDGRVASLENYKPNVISVIVPADKSVLLTGTTGTTLTNAALTTGKFAYVDWNVRDDNNYNSLQSVILPLELMRSGNKVFYVNECYNGDWQGLIFSLGSNYLKIQTTCLGENMSQSSNKLWIRYLAVFKYYLNTVLGWVM